MVTSAKEEPKDMPISVLQSSVVPLGLVAAPAEGGAPDTATTLEGQAISKSLDFKMQHQLQKYWCWAAVTSSVTAYYKRSNWTQCRLANRTLGQATCCVNGDTQECNKAWFLEKALQFVQHFEAIAPQPLTLREIQAEIDADRPVGVRVQWPIAPGQRSPSGHFIAIGGYHEDTVHVHDPWSGDSLVDYSTLRSNYGVNRGRWTHTYRTSPGVQS